MTDFNIRSDSVDVEQIMERIRARVREKRGQDYTEDEIRELANVKLERFLDPKSIRSDLLEHYRRAKPLEPLSLALPPPNYEFGEDTIYTSTRPVLRLIRRLLNPILKLFFSPNPIIQSLNLQSRINEHLFAIDNRIRVRNELDLLNYELLQNLVVETTRASIEVKNMKMHVEALAARLDFVERRARALEGVVQYRTEALPVVRPITAGGDAAPADAGAEKGTRKRRRRRGRRRPADAPAGDAADQAVPAAGGVPAEPRAATSADSGPWEAGSVPAPPAPAAAEDPEPTES